MVPLGLSEINHSCIILSTANFDDTNDIIHASDQSGSRNNLQPAIRRVHYAKTSLHFFLLPLLYQDAISTSIFNFTL